MITSTPNTSRELCDVKLNDDSDVIAVDRSSSPPIVLSDGSMNSLKLGSCKYDKDGQFHVDFEQTHTQTTVDVDVEAKPRCQSKACSANVNESIGSSSPAGSAGSEARSRCLENKLTATLEVLKNKEETVRVQAESLALAEARIAALATRAQPAKTHRADQTQPLHSTRSSADGCCVETSDVTAHTQEAGRDVVVTLQDNLSIIEDLYRECFYEAAKQEELIDLLRKSCLDVRLMERQKEARIGRLQSALDTHKWSLERCQDIALEVENLKLEISNFLNSSNHDSGMWERTEEPPAAEVADELHHISGQLLQLRELLNDGCSCGLERENMRLKQINETLEIKLGELRSRVSELEVALEDKENLGQHYQRQIHLKDQELISLQQRLSALEADATEHRTSCNDLHLQVQQLQALLHERTDELTRAQQHCEGQEATIGGLRLELGRAENVAKEQNEKVRSEVSQLSTAVGRWREQLADSRRRLRALDEELHNERQHCRHLEHHYEEQTREAAALRGQLEEARARGAALCEEAQRAVCGVRRWLRRARLRHREQEQTIEEQEKLIRVLQQRQSSEDVRSSSEPCCSRQVRGRSVRAGASETASCSKCPSLTQDARTSMSDMSSASAPTPPRRSKKKLLCDDRECQWPARRDASSQRPARRDAHTDRVPKEMSPTDELLERVDRTHEALAEARRRWRLGTSFADLRRDT